MKQLRTPTDIKQLGSILSVWAHPDDETFTCGGIIATAVKNGQHVACVTMTKGEAGSQDLQRWPAESLGEIRAKELHQALDILGCKHHIIYDYPDGGLPNISDEEGVGIIRNLVTEYQPDTILTFGPEGMTGHSDHQTVSRWVSLATDGMQKKPMVYHAVELRSTYDNFMKDLDNRFNIYFNIDEPPLKTEAECDIYYELPDEICKQKCSALAAMPSQTEKLMEELGKNAKKVFSKEGFVRAS